MSDLRGALRSVGLLPLLRLLAEAGQSGVLRITAGHWSGELAFDAGRPVAATAGSTRGLAALETIALALWDGEFEFQRADPREAGPRADADLVDANVRGFVHGLLAEQERWKEAGLTPRGVPRMSSGEGAGSARRPGIDDEAMRWIFTRVDGRRSVQEVVGERQPLQGLRQLAALVGVGLVTIDTPRAHDASPVAEATTARRSASSRACPRLGFVDSPEECSSRPSYLHRCWATAAPFRLSTMDQRDLCLSGRYRVCSRFQGQFGPSTGESAPAAPVLPGAPVATTTTTTTTTTVVRLPTPTAEPAIEATGQTGVAAPALPATATAVQARPPSVLRDILDAPRADVPPAPPTPRAPLSGQRWGLILGAVIAAVILIATLAPFPRPSTGSEQPTIPATAEPTSQPTVGPAPVAPTFAPPAAPAATALPAVPRPTETAAAMRALGPPAVATAAPTRSPTPAPTVAPTREAVAALVLDERFAAPPAGWPNNPQGTAWAADGVYRLAARQPGQFVAVGVPVPVSGLPRDVVVSAAFRKTGGPPGGGYGLILRARGTALDGRDQGGRFYVLEAGDRGEVGAWRRDGDRWVDLLAWTRSTAVRPGTERNELEVRAVGARLTFLVNGVTVAEITDPALAEGSVGVFLGGDDNQAILERLTIRRPS